MNKEESIKELEYVINYCKKYTKEYNTDEIYTSQIKMPFKAIETVLKELDNSISKDKIREKIEELQKRANRLYKNLEIYHSCEHCNNNCSFYPKCTTLQELLEESN